MGVTVGAAEGGTTRRGRWKPEKRCGEEGEGVQKMGKKWARGGNNRVTAAAAAGKLLVT